MSNFVQQSLHTCIADAHYFNSLYLRLLVLTQFSNSLQLSLRTRVYLAEAAWRESQTSMKVHMKNVKNPCIRRSFTFFIFTFTLGVDNF